MTERDGVITLEAITGAHEDIPYVIPFDEERLADIRYIEDVTCDGTRLSFRVTPAHVPREVVESVAVIAGIHLSPEQISEVVYKRLDFWIRPIN